MIVHHFKMRPNVITYNLSGMGCSAGIISIGLAKELLQVGHLLSLPIPYAIIPTLNTYRPKSERAHLSCLLDRASKDLTCLF
jgi:hypothetical protein